MKKRSRHTIKKEKLAAERLKKREKEKRLGLIFVALIVIAGCIANFFIGKAINDGNMFFILFPLIVRAAIFATFILVVLILVIKQKLRQ